MLDADIETQLDYRVKTGRPVPLVDLRIVDPLMNDQPKDNQVRRRDRGPGPLADPGLL